MRMSELATKVVQGLMFACAFVFVWIPTIAIALDEWRKARRREEELKITRWRTSDANTRYS